MRPASERSGAGGSGGEGAGPQDRRGPPPGGSPPGRPRAPPRSSARARCPARGARGARPARRREAGKGGPAEIERHARRNARPAAGCPRAAHAAAARSARRRQTIQEGRRGSGPPPPLTADRHWSRRSGARPPARSRCRRPARTRHTRPRAAACSCTARHVADLVEEEGAAVRQLEAAPPAPTAPVNAPFSWPNSSLSSSVSGSAAAVDLEQRPDPARRQVVQARAISSLPVPRSPTTSTGRSSGAIRPPPHQAEEGGRTTHKRGECLGLSS